MIRILLTIAAASLVVCALAVGGFAGLGGIRAIEDGAFEFGSRDWDDGDHHGRHRVRLSDTPHAERSLVWAGGDALTLDLAADVSFTQGPTASITVTGPKPLVDRVTFEDGRIGMTDTDGLDGYSHWGHGRRRLKVIVTGPDVKRFAINGSSDLTIKGYDHPDLDIDISGSGDVDAVGKTGALTLTISGSGDAGLRGLAAGSATVTINGSGDAEVDATDAAKIKINGSGDVSLPRRPAKLERDIAGSGDLDVPD